MMVPAFIVLSISQSGHTCGCLGGPRSGSRPQTKGGIEKPIPKERAYSVCHLALPSNIDCSDDVARNSWLMHLEE
jgi:hypothetical protein